MAQRVKVAVLYPRFLAETLEVVKQIVPVLILIYAILTSTSLAWSFLPLGMAYCLVAARQAESLLRELLTI